MPPIGTSLWSVADYPHPSSQGRSANMKANRRTDTKPELALRHALHRLGYRYRKDYRLDLASEAVWLDIAFTARKVAVFVDGCFWHACPEHGSKPRANEWYWGPKLIKNVERDRVNDAALILAGVDRGPALGARATRRGHHDRGHRPHRTRPGRRTPARPKRPGRGSQTSPAPEPTGRRLA